MTSAPDNLATVVDDMLLDAGCGQDAELRTALLSLGALASLPAPAPGGELAALLGANGPPAAAGSLPRAGEDSRPAAQRPEPAPGGQPVDDLARRRRRHRPTALGLVLVAGMGLGVGGVAASSSVPGSSALEHVLEEWTPWSGVAGATSVAGYRGPALAADGDLAGTAPAAAPGGAADAATLPSRLRRSSAGVSGLAPACPGPVRLGAGGASRRCAAGGAGLPGAGAGGSRDASGAGAADGTPVAPGENGAGKAEATASNTPAGGGDAAGSSGQKAAGSAGNGDTAASQGQSQEAAAQGGSQGNAQKNAAPAK